jgi:tRNA pseudouridine13 synthase
MIGMGCYVTSTDGVGGRLRDSPEDFIVEEILRDGGITQVGIGLPDHGERDQPGGRYSHFALEKRGIDLFGALKELARRAGISRKRLGYSGIKDARALTCQLVSVEGLAPDALPESSGRVRIHTPFRATKPLALGDHWGNSFTVRISGIKADPEGTRRQVRETLDEMLRLGGVPNFYGHQRFGTARPNTHLVGKSLIEGDFKGAVEEYLAGTFSGEDERVTSARDELRESGDYSKALNAFPRSLGYERAMLDHLARYPRDYVGAFGRIPRRLVSLLIRACQSYMFNLALTGRLEDPEPFSPRSGDVVEEGPSHRIVGDDISPSEAEALLASGAGRLVFSVIGYATRAEGPVSPEVEAVMAETGVRDANFYLRQFQDVSPRGGYRAILCPVRDLRLKPTLQGPSGTEVEVSFRLEKGSYATAVLREFMKTDIRSY